MSEFASVENPFLFMMNPQVVLDAVQQSDRLAGLNRRICRPLDRRWLVPKYVSPADLEIDADDASDDDYVPFDEA